jgi:DNA transposition AAA+ family ATPase
METENKTETTARAARSRSLKRAGIEEERTVDTVTAKRLTLALDVTAERGMFSFIFGESGRGKTFIAKKWLAQNPGGAYISCQANESVSTLRRRLGAELLGSAGTVSEIVDALKNKPALIVDEANKLILTQSRLVAAKNLDFFRDIYDGAGCGVALIFTNYTLNALQNGALGSFIGQFVGRMGYHLNIPDKLSRKEEIIPALQSFVQSPGPELTEAAYKIAMESPASMKTLYKYLKLAAEYSEAEKVTITPKLLKSLQNRYEDGGVWPEE